MTNFLADNPLLLLFLVAAIGFLVGKIKIKGTGLGVAAVLFVGLGFGMINPEYNVDDIVFELGLIFFVYSIGLSSGPAFFQLFQKNGWRDISYILTTLVCTFLVAIGVYYAFGFDNQTITGLYSGSTTNTTALASVIDMMKNISKKELRDNLQELVVAYTYSYPIGVVGVMLVLKLMERLFKVDYKSELNQLKGEYPIDEKITSITATVQNVRLDGKQLRDVKQTLGYNILFGRIRKGDEVTLASYDTILNNGDELMIIGGVSDLEQVVPLIGQESDGAIFHDRRNYDIRQIFVSNIEIVGKSLSSLNLSEKYDVIITRIRRGDIDLLATPDTILEQGDRIRFIARRKDLDELSQLFGDSYFQSSRLNLFSFGLGIAMGLLLGLIEFSLPGGLSFKLGYAGGPLIVGIILGALRRTGPIVWTLPYSANVTLQQLGLILLLAVIGLRSGNSFLESLGQLEGLSIFIGGLCLTLISTVISIIIGYKIFKIPYSLILGFMSNQPAILDYSQELTKNKIPMFGYTLMFPIAMILKILFAQILYIILS